MFTVTYTVRMKQNGITMLEATEPFKTKQEAAKRWMDVRAMTNDKWYIADLKIDATQISPVM